MVGKPVFLVTLAYALCMANARCEGNECASAADDSTSLMQVKKQVQEGSSRAAGESVNAVQKKTAPPQPPDVSRDDWCDILEEKGYGAEEVKKAREAPSGPTEDNDKEIIFNEAGKIVEIRTRRDQATQEVDELLMARAASADVTWKKTLDRKRLNGRNTAQAITINGRKERGRGRQTRLGYVDKDWEHIYTGKVMAARNGAKSPWVLGKVTQVGQRNSGPGTGNPMLIAPVNSETGNPGFEYERVRDVEMKMAFYNPRGVKITEKKCVRPNNAIAIAIVPQSLTGCFQLKWIKVMPGAPTNVYSAKMDCDANSGVTLRMYQDSNCKQKLGDDHNKHMDDKSYSAFRQGNCALTDTDGRKNTQFVQLYTGSPADGYNVRTPLSPFTDGSFVDYDYFPTIAKCKDKAGQEAEHKLFEKYDNNDYQCCCKESRDYTACIGGDEWSPVRRFAHVKGEDTTICCMPVSGWGCEWGFGRFGTNIKKYEIMETDQGYTMNDHSCKQEDVLGRPIDVNAGLKEHMTLQQCRAGALGTPIPTEETCGRQSECDAGRCRSLRCKFAVKAHCFFSRIIDGVDPDDDGTKEGILAALNRYDLPSLPWDKPEEEVLNHATDTKNARNDIIQKGSLVGKFTEYFDADARVAQQEALSVDAPSLNSATTDLLTVAGPAKLAAGVFVSILSLLKAVCLSNFKCGAGSGKAKAAGVAFGIVLGITAILLIMFQVTVPPAGWLAIMLAGPVMSSLVSDICEKGFSETFEDWFVTSWDKKKKAMADAFEENRVDTYHSAWFAKMRGSNDALYLFAGLRTIGDGLVNLGKWLVSFVWGILKSVFAIIKTALLLIPNLVSAVIDAIGDSDIFKRNSTISQAQVAKYRQSQCCIQMKEDENTIGLQAELAQLEETQEEELAEEIENVVAGPRD